MSVWTLIPLITCITYIILFLLSLASIKKRGNAQFAYYLAISAMWSFSAFMLRFNPIHVIFWNQVLIVVLIWSLITYYHFIRVYTGKSAGKLVYLGYVLLILLGVLCFTGLIVKSAFVIDGVLYNELGKSVFIIGAISLTFIGAGLYQLAKKYRASSDSVDRNRTMYLMIGWSILILLSYSNLIPALAGRPLDHIGSLCNALIITYAISRFNLLDFGFLIRKSLAFLLAILLIGGLIVGLVLLEKEYFINYELYVSIIFFTGIAVFLFLLTQRLKFGVQAWIDRLFYGETYSYRQALLKFNTTMGTIIDLKQLADVMLPSVSKAIKITNVKLLFEDADSGDFNTLFMYPETEDEPGKEFNLKNDSPIVAWLQKTLNHLDLSKIENNPEFKSLWDIEKEKLVNSNMELLFPIKSRGKLIGILGLGPKKSKGLFSGDDTQLVASLATQAGIIVENARLYSQAVIWAHTDGLTNLYNHRYFDERLEQEIERGSRFGTIFSLIIADLDYFKRYNDTYGHLAGNEVLIETAKCIKDSIRNVDMAFRYGGEEFIMILPETPLEGAYLVSERIRKKLESMTLGGRSPVTSSFGIACWPMDGLVKEDLVVSADAALYLAKQTGRNRICLSSDTKKQDISPLSSFEPLASRRELSRVYALAAIVDAKDHYTYDHSKRVSEYVVAVAEAMKLDPDRIAAIRTAGLLHDIGKIGVPDYILNKQGPLSQEEWEPVKNHVKLGAEIIKYIDELAQCLPIILNHHERYDSKGYPFGRTGGEIPLEARLLAIADSYEAMTSNRSYHRPRSHEEAINELKRCAGAQFDPELVKIFCEVIKPHVVKEEGEK